VSKETGRRRRFVLGLPELEKKPEASMKGKGGIVMKAQSSGVWGKPSGGGNRNAGK